MSQPLRTFFAFHLSAVINVNYNSSPSLLISIQSSLHSPLCALRSLRDFSTFPEDKNAEKPILEHQNFRLSPSSPALLSPEIGVPLEFRGGFPRFPKVEGEKSLESAGGAGEAALAMLNSFFGRSSLAQTVLLSHGSVSG